MIKREPCTEPARSPGGRKVSSGKEGMIEFHAGSILAADVEAVVNPANAHGVMGAGLALQFKNKYPRMFAESTRHFSMIERSGRRISLCCAIMDR